MAILGGDLGRFAAIYGLAIYFKVQSYNSNTTIITILSCFYNCVYTHTELYSPFNCSTVFCNFNSYLGNATLLGPQVQQRQPFLVQIRSNPGLTYLSSKVII